MKRTNSSTTTTSTLATALVIGLVAITLTLFTVAGNHGLLHLREINNELQLLLTKNRNLESEIVSLQNEIHAVQTSDFVLEKRAREELGLSRQNEIVYVFSEKQKTERQKSEQPKSDLSRSAR